MENPGSLLRRARNSRHFKAVPNPPEMQESEVKTPIAQPVHRSSHASYTALMRSHDRMRTRHIGGQGGESGA